MGTLIKPVLFSSLAIASGITLIATRSKDASSRADDIKSSGIAVVELFTSEGCSSCPPADKALMDLVDRTRRDGRKVLALSFHVDYWNRLGWKDPFSAPAWSDRQRFYSSGTGDDVYTPQCVVNGTKSFVGSDTDQLEQAVNAALARDAPVTIDAKVHGATGELTIDYTVSGDVDDTELNIAVVENGLASNVRAGENKGRHLAHTHVVRSLRTVALGKAGREGSIPLDITKVADPAKARAILFVQRKGQGAIIGATSVNARMDG